MAMVTDKKHHVWQGFPHAELTLHWQVLSIPNDLIIPCVAFCFGSRWVPEATGVLRALIESKI